MKKISISEKIIKVSNLAYKMLKNTEDYFCEYVDIAFCKRTTDWFCYLIIDSNGDGTPLYIDMLSKRQIDLKTNDLIFGGVGETLFKALNDLELNIKDCIKEFQEQSKLCTKCGK